MGKITENIIAFILLTILVVTISVGILWVLTACINVLLPVIGVVFTVKMYQVACGLILIGLLKWMFS